MDKTQFSLHGLRAGGATDSARSGVADRLFKKHGRWKSENWKDRYVKESLTDRLKVTLNLGIWFKKSLLLWLSIVCYYYMYTYVYLCFGVPSGRG